jgi:hypothetical protein
VHADLVELAAALEASIPRSTTSRLIPPCLASGSVLATTMTRSARMPLVMKVLAPLSR